MMNAVHRPRRRRHRRLLMAHSLNSALAHPRLLAYQLDFVDTRDFAVGV